MEKGVIGLAKAQSDGYAVGRFERGNRDMGHCRRQTGQNKVIKRGEKANNTTPLPVTAR